MAYNHGLPIKMKGVSFVTETIGGNAPELGQETYDSEGNKYVFVYNSCNSQILPTYGVTIQSGTSTGYSVTLTSAVEADIAVGVCKHATIPTASYGWVLTRGHATVEMAGTSGTVATNGLLVMAADGTFGPKSDTVANAVGKAKEAIVSGASGTAYISIY